MLKSIKIRLYPNNTQEVQINKLLGCYRVVYNQCLSRKINSYKENKISETRTSLSKFYHHELITDPNFIWLKEQNSKILKCAIADMLSAYNMFFKCHSGFPKFKSKHDNKQSCRIEIGAISKRNVYTDYKLSLGNIKILNSDVIRNMQNIFKNIKIILDKLHYQNCHVVSITYQY